MSGYPYRAAKFLAVYPSVWIFFVIWIKGAVSQVFDTLKKAPACGGRGFLRENWESELFVKIRGLCVQKYLYPASALFKHRPVLFSQSIYQRHFIPGHRPQPNSSHSLPRSSPGLCFLLIHHLSMACCYLWFFSRASVPKDRRPRTAKKPKK